jgi:hypothetical protein
MRLSIGGSFVFCHKRFHFAQSIAQQENSRHKPRCRNPFISDDFSGAATSGGRPRFALADGAVAVRSGSASLTPGMMAGAATGDVACDHYRRMEPTSR